MIYKNIKIIKNSSFADGFTLLEITVSISLFVMIIFLSSSLYSLSQKSYNKISDKGELIQNARVSLDRITRELRQSANIITVLPETGDDPENLPAQEIFFQNGHDTDQIMYIRYYLDNTNLKKIVIVYYFDEDPDVYVSYDSVDQSGDPPEELIIENRIVGEYFSGLEFWGIGGLIHISFNLEKNQDIFNIDTSVFVRN